MSKNKYGPDLELPVAKTSADKKILKLMQNMKSEMKSLSHNELARQYVNLFAQHIHLQSTFEELLTKTNDANRASQTLTTEPLAITPQEPSQEGSPS